MHLDIYDGRWTYDGTQEQIARELKAQIDPKTVDIWALAAAIHEVEVGDIATDADAHEGIAWIQKFDPQVPEHEEIEDAIRTQLKEKRSGVVELPAMKIELTDCAYKGGTPLMDKPLNGHLGTITVTRPDGETRTLTMDGTTWTDLWAMIDRLYDGWDIEVIELGSQLVAAVKTVKRIENTLQTAKDQRNQLTRQLTANGVTKYKIAQVIGASQPTVAGWEKTKR